MNRDSPIKFIAYRDVILPSSESFIPRQYQVFNRLSPIWLGSRSIVTGPQRERLIGTDGEIITLPIHRRDLWRQLGYIPRQFSHLMSRPVEQKPRLIHANFGRGGALALPLALRFGLPLAVTYHGGDATKDRHYNRRMGLPSLYLRRLPRLLDYASIIICVSEFIRATLLRRGFPPEKLIVNPYGIEPAAPKDWAVFGLDSTPPYLFFAGRLVEKKGVEYLLRAFATVMTELPELQLVIAGDGELGPSLRQLAGEISSEQIKFIGWQTPEQLLAWRRGAAAVVVPSVTSHSGDAEGLPNVVLEAMAQGCAVIGSRHAGISEAIVDHDSGLLVAERDVAGLAAAMMQVVSNPTMAQQLGSAARTRVSETYDATRQSQRLESILLAAISTDDNSNQGHCCD
ncbi:MAG: glycosyltransferase [Candidatus Pacebacteria bacterium]|nr:glycosyltransferase [Candidatus Paceibacterota bacterium]